MSDLINKERMADAENLTKQVQSIRSEMDEIQNEYNRKAAPYRQRIKQLEEEYLDKWLKDSNGNPVKIGMTIQKDSKRYEVVDRYQQQLFQYLGNPRVIAINKVRGRRIELSTADLKEYTIVENESI
jgi:hypothetical protein